MSLRPFSASFRLLVAAAGNLTRRIYASLPWETRLANFFEKLASMDTSRTFGAYVYLLAFFHGAQGAEIPPGFEVPQGKSQDWYVNRMMGKAMSANIGRKFGERSFGVALGFTKNPEKAEDLLSDLQAKVVAGKFNSVLSTSMGSIESNLMNALKNAAKDFLRSKGHKVVDQIKEDEHGAQVQHVDLNSVNKMHQILEPQDVPKVMEKLKKDNPRFGDDLALYFDLLMDDHNPRQVYLHRALPIMQTNLPPDIKAKAEHLGPEKLMSLSDHEVAELFGDIPNAVGSQGTFYTKFKNAIEESLQEYIDGKMP